MSLPPVLRKRGWGCEFKNSTFQNRYPQIVITFCCCGINTSARKEMKPLRSNFLMVTQKLVDANS